MIGKLFKPLLEKYSEWQVGSMICLHFYWHGASGEDAFAFKILQENCFPLQWLPKNVNSYRAYIVNTLGIDWDNLGEVRSYVVDTVSGIKEKDSAE